MICFVTASGSGFTVHNGRISRHSGHLVVNSNTGEEIPADICGEPFTWLTRPVLGGCAQLVLKDRSHKLGGGRPLTTTRIVELEEL